MGNIVIVGGELHNKGAQAMTFTVVDEIKKKHPNKKIILLASAYTKRDEIEKQNLTFEILPWNLRIQMKLLGFPNNKHIGFIDYIKYLIKGPGIDKSKIKIYESILNNTELIIDISGYALSSQRGFVPSISYLYNIMLASKLNIPIYLLPQSFGPFDYNEKEKKVIIPLIEKYLAYPKRIFIRENDGIKYLSRFSLNNIVKSYDCVLQSDREYNPENIYKKGYRIKNVRIQSNSIAIVPNVQIMRHGNSEEIFNLYHYIINKLLEKGKKVYLIRHSFGDLEICRKIKNNFKHVKDVILLEDDLNCIEINNILKNFDFIIASRYHSIIHAYKNEVPTLVLSWAIKYDELLQLFNQEKYLFDVRYKLNKNLILKRVDELLESHEKESINIKNKILSLKSNNVNIFEQIAL